MRRLRHSALQAGLAGSTVLTILFMPDDQFKALIASLVSGAFTSILSSVVTNWVYALFNLPAIAVAG